MKKGLIFLVIALWISLLPDMSSRAAAAPVTYEAEDAALNGVSVSSAGSGFSGSGYVTGFDDPSDSVAFTVSVPSRQLYTLTVRYRSPFSNKNTALSVNGQSAGELVLAQSADFVDMAGGKILLNAGTNQITLSNDWGYYDIDCIRLEQSPAPAPHVIDRVPVNPGASPAVRSLLNYLADQYGTHILSGQADMTGVDWLQTNIGKLPAIAGFDLMDYSPSRVARGATSNQIDQALAWDQQGGIVTVYWHWNAPSGLIDQPGKEWWRGFYTDASTFDVAYAMSHPSSQEYQDIVRDIDAIAVQLQRLKDANVPVLFRPLHEADGGWFWWGAKGAGPAKQLYQLLYDRLTNYHQLNNLIWVWNSGNPDWYPGDASVDIVSADVYSAAGDYNPLSSVYDSINTLGQNRKLVALAENGPIPDPDLLPVYHADWSWFMTWPGDFLTDGVQNSHDHLVHVFNSPYVITKDELPNIKTYTSVKSNNGYPLFKIVNRNSGKAISVPGVDPNPGANVAQWSYAGNPDQWWSLEPTGDGYFVVRANHSQLVLDVLNFGTNDGANVIQYNDNHTANQQWRLISLGDGYYNLENRNSGKMLDVAGGSTDDNGNIQQWSANGATAQQFRLEPVGNFKLINVNSGKALDVNGASLADGGNIQQWEDNGCLCQRWRFDTLANGYFRIANENSGKAVDVAGLVDANGTNIRQWSYLDNPGQHWRLEFAADGSVSLRPELNGSRTIDVEGFSTANGANVSLYDANNTSNQQWRLTP
ncbi:glycosyl hydrolase [Cohnella sp. 56]|uniref:glycosyl hydrolase n=1 Tax=Cohnella sp. 56 TaxID=3113722 RepID=UPI0030EAB5BF